MLHHRHLPICALLLSFTCLAAIGCSDNGGLATLHGTVTIDGKPAPAGIPLQFNPIGQGRSQSYGSTDENGRYQAEFTFNKTGIQPGLYSIRLGPNVQQASPGIKSSTPNLPKAYYEEIEQLTVDPGSNTHDIRLLTE